MKAFEVGTQKKSNAGDKGRGSGKNERAICLLFFEVLSWKNCAMEEVVGEHVLQ